MKGVWFTISIDINSIVVMSSVPVFLQKVVCLADRKAVQVIQVTPHRPNEFSKI